MKESRAFKNIKDKKKKRPDKKLPRINESKNVRGPPIDKMQRGRCSK